ncbi:restriction endonuclease subunit S [Aeromonas hydrophila]|uniref:restriction endonuclease subunit S n=1 Tax=Aeromonas hydrophila TaxID=644 RepID=UPI0035A39979
MAEQMMQETAGKAIPAGYQQTEVGVIPEDWALLTIDDVALFSGGAQPAKNFFSSKPKDGYIRLIQIRDYKTSEYETYIPETLARKLCSEYDIMIGRYGPPIFQILKGIRGAYNVALIKAEPKKLIEREYLFYYLKTDKLFSLMDMLSQRSSGQTGVELPALKAYPIPLPPKQEQTAIANVLSDSDALIDALEQLIAKKQAIKSATMQQLLTGRTRLPAFALHPDGTQKGYKLSELGEIPEDWEAASLGSLLKETPRYGINAPAVPLTGDTPVYIRITDISDDGYFNPGEKVGVNSPFSGMYFLSAGDIVLARTGASVGKSYLYNKNDGQLVYAGFLIKVSPNQERLSSMFLSQYLKSHRYWNWVVVNSMRSGQPGINGSEYASLLIPTPTIEEQTAIATILSDMDNELQVLTQKLEKARALKQGMMQQLLTGKIRLIKRENHD